MTEQIREGEFLRCDAAGCDHFEMTPVTIDVVNKACPKCGANLCTEDDFIIFRSFVAATRASTSVALAKDPNTELILVAHNIRDGRLLVVVDPTQQNPFPNEAAE